jgi:NADH:ubiquinone oxidoreductase subunit C
MQSSPQPTPPSKTTGLSARILERFPSVKVDYAKPRRLKVTVPVELVREVALFARDELHFDHIGTVSGTDYMSKGEFEVIYFVGSTDPDQQELVIEIAERVKRVEPLVPSLVEVWPGAEFHERETFEMLGVRFQGHPDMRGILLPEDWDDIPPLRKDYISPGR